jgi:hypothetical protein
MSETASNDPKYLSAPSRVTTLTAPDMMRPYSALNPPVSTTTSEIALLLIAVLEVPVSGSCCEKPSTKYAVSLGRPPRMMSVLPFCASLSMLRAKFTTPVCWAAASR